VCPISGCSISIKNGLPIYAPLLLKRRGSKDVHGFYLPKGTAGILTLARGEKMFVACPGKDNGFENRNLRGELVLATCDSGTKFFVNSISYTFSNFACKSYPFHTARYSGSKCYHRTKRNIEVGFQVQNSGFYKLMDICFDDVLNTTLYVNATIVAGIAGNEAGLKKPNFTPDNFFPGMSVDTLYTIPTQTQTISDILDLQPSNNKFLNATHFLSRGHLSAKSDFVYASQQNATFRFVNVAPQWQPFNEGNWEKLESSVRAYADKKKLDLVVYTGTYDVATLPNDNGIKTKLYLYFDVNKNPGIPVPKFFWKAVYEPKSKAGVVFVGINNPHIDISDIFDVTNCYLICTDVCSEILWIKWKQIDVTKGYSYCCEVDEFRSRVDYLPQFTVSGLLR
jgi:hypothetical protein